MPIISVIVPAYNAEATLLTTLQSVQQQTFSDFELIVINDGSTDRTLEILQAFDDRRLKFFSVKNGGPAWARNHGLAAATGEFIAPLDADDQWTPEKLELQLAALQQHPEAGVAYSWTCNIKDGQVISRVEPTYNGEVYADLLMGNFLSNGSNPLIRRQAIEVVGEFDCNFPLVCDWDYWLRLAAQYPFVLVPQHQILYRLSNQSLTTQIEIQKQENLRLLTQAFHQAPPELQKLKGRSFANIYLYAVEVYVRSRGNAHLNQAINYLRQAIQYYPLCLFDRYTQLLILKVFAIQLLPVQWLVQRSKNEDQKTGSSSANAHRLSSESSLTKTSNTLSNTLNNTLNNTQIGYHFNTSSSIPDQHQHKTQTIALFPCCDLFEDFFSTIGITLDSFCQELTGGWMFNYIEALQSANIQTVLFFFSDQVLVPTYFNHRPTGAQVCVLPPTRIYRFYRQLRRRLGVQSNWTAADLNEKAAAVGNSSVSNQRTIQRTWQNTIVQAIKQAANSAGIYVSTPLGLLTHQLRQAGCTAILCQDYEYARFDVCVLLGRIIGLPVYATFQGGDRLASWIEYPGRWLSLRTCAGLIIASQMERQRVCQTYRLSPDRIHGIVNPMDVQTWQSVDRQSTRAALGITDDTQVVIYHGRIQLHQKGLDILLTAWDQLCSRAVHSNRLLLLIGTGADAPQLHQMIMHLSHDVVAKPISDTENFYTLYHLAKNRIDQAKPNSSNILWINQYVRDRQAIQRYLSAADLYVLPSRKEGFPVAPIEAMACSLPVVATQVAGITDILGKPDVQNTRNILDETTILDEITLSGGVIVPTEDPHALAQAIEQILQNSSQRQILGTQARQRVETQFSLEAVGQQLRALLFPTL
ncbi:MAG: glycosyltransferase [Elainella sp. Prado103]|jgi:starch synthase|nr:glycosyltransferase [Elainella sp. Prado103]